MKNNWNLKNLASSAVRSLKTWACLGCLLIAPGIASATCYVSAASALPYAVGAAGTTGAVAISAPAGCPWTFHNRGASWIQILSAQSGSGSAVVYYRILPNTTRRVRTFPFGPEGATVSTGYIGGRSGGGVTTSVGFTITVTQYAQ
jgi:hypothetical protein